MLKVLVVGGGSGGHITPAVAVVREILEQKPRTRVEFWTDRKYYKNVVKITTEIGVRWGSAVPVTQGRGKIRIFGCGRCWQGSSTGMRGGLGRIISGTFR